MAKLTCGIAIPGVFERDGRYYRVFSEGPKKRWVALSRIDEGQGTLLRTLYELDPAQPGTLGELIELYRATGMDTLRESTRRRYGLSLNALQHHFGKMRIGTLKPKQVAVFLEKRRRAGRGAISANREFAVLSSVHRFGMRNGWIESNPCIGVGRNPEHPRKRAVTNDEFREAFERSPEPFQDLMAVAYLTGARMGDVISWKRSEHLKAAGIDFTELKTGKPHMIAWSDALSFFVRRAIKRFPEAEHVLTNRFGLPWGQWAISSQMRRLAVTWTFRDLRAKAQSDATHSVLGHGPAMEALYRKVLRTKPVR